MTPEDAVAYVETLSRRHGLGELTPTHRARVISDLRAHPDIIRKFIEQSEARIEQASESCKETAA